MSLAEIDRRKKRAVTIALWASWAVIMLLAIGLFTRRAPEIGRAMQGAKLHLPDLPALQQAPLAIQVHIAATLGAAVLGAVMLLSRKGAAFHRTAGWTWAALMATAAVTPLLVLGQPGYRLNFIFATVPLVLVLLPRGLMAARRHDVTQHRSSMRWLYAMLIGAGLATAVPGRLMWDVFFG